MLKKLSFLLLLLCFGVIKAQGPYSPAVGQSGSTAISKESSSFVAWATGVELQRGYINIEDTSAKYDNTNRASFGKASFCLGKALGNSFDVVSLGDKGVATLTFDRPIVNGVGADFAVFENGFNDTFLELAFVEVSSDGERFVRFPSVSLTQINSQVGGYNNLDPTNIHNLAGKYSQGYGTPFNLNDLKDSIGLDLLNIRFVRIIDVCGSISDEYASYDSKGNKINDPYPTPFHSGGFDLDGVGIINGGTPYIISSLDELTLGVDTFFNPQDSVSFISGDVVYPYLYSTYAWYGFAYSNHFSVINSFEHDQYTAITKGGVKGDSTNYVVSSIALDWMSGTNAPIANELTFKNEEKHLVSGFYVTNTSYTANSMKNGDFFAKKFGGDTGDDLDWYKLMIWGMKEDSTNTDTVEFYLADYRFVDNSLDYIVNDWRWVDLKKLGEVKKIYCNVLSSDVGSWGMNTPAYFCIDNLTILTDQLPVIMDNVTDFEIAKTTKPVIYNNPCKDYFIVNAESSSVLLIYNLSGNIVKKQILNEKQSTVFVEDLSSGYYLVKIVTGNNVSTTKLMKL
ncbi:MAG: hypothetical protein A2X12_08890 [Bacteroidetes bacterium GWE2_29_8]|nr:MAG: hypothetical protein A2X12_08890 [Bacteroidetes bacterium GWE2_29_8]OFY18497.1 MAG: hypothetical protein A2X02_07735 [Bacteroidetes bacterium GWF2_29_10]